VAESKAPTYAAVAAIVLGGALLSLVAGCIGGAVAGCLAAGVHPSKPGFRCRARTCTASVYGFSCPFPRLLASARWSS